MANVAASGDRTIGRQMVLPLSKAVEIAYKNVRMRLSRSLLVTSGIILAIAFLMSIQASDMMVNAMRQWMRDVEKTPRFVQLHAQKDAIDAKILPLETLLRKQPGPAVDQDKVKEALGATTTDLNSELGIVLDFIPNAIGSKKIDEAKEWLALQRQVLPIRTELGGPGDLSKLFTQNGVAMDAADVKAAKTQTHWVLGLALLVAFVGILNAMLMSVTERFREIGTMKCLGALDSFIVKLFLVESLFQGFVGTVFGVVVGMGLSVGMLAWTYGHFAWTTLPWGEVMSAAGVCLAVGVGLTVGAAVYPAWQAARMQPIEAMRSDA